MYVYQGRGGSLYTEEGKGGGGVFGVHEVPKCEARPVRERGARGVAPHRGMEGRTDGGGEKGREERGLPGSGRVQVAADGQVLGGTHGMGGKHSHGPTAPGGRRNGEREGGGGM